MTKLTEDTDKKELLIDSCSHCATRLGWWDARHMVRQSRRVNEGRGRCNYEVEEGQGCHVSKGKGCKNWLVKGRMACMHAQCAHLVLPNSAWVRRQ